jgi:uncharacterized protein (DUF2236 family)
MDPRPLRLPRLLQDALERVNAGLYQPAGREHEDFTRPPGEAALMAPDSVSWTVFKNPVVLFIGGVAAVVLELAEPHVRTGVWEHSAFRGQPLERLRRTALAAVVTVYGPRSRAEAMIARVTRLHERVSGTTPHGDRYAAVDPELLTWVQATAAFGFLEAYHAYVRPLRDDERDRYYAEGQAAAHLYGARDAPASQAAMEALFAHMHDRLEPSDIVHEFLDIVRRMPALPAPLRPLQALLIRAAVDIVPASARERLGLRDRRLARWQRDLIRGLARSADRLLLSSSAAVQSCRRLALQDDFLYAASKRHVASPAICRSRRTP